MVYGYVCEYHKMCTYIIYHIYIYTIVTICGFPICISVLNMYIIFIHCICISTEHKWWRLPLGPQLRSSTSLRGLNHGDSWTEKRGRGIVKWDRKNDIDIDSYPPKKKEKGEIDRYSSRILCVSILLAVAICVHIICILFYFTIFWLYCITRFLGQDIISSYGHIYDHHIWLRW
jgi:hypothetical protein